MKSHQRNILLKKAKEILSVVVLFWVFIRFFPLAKHDMVEIGSIVIVLFLAEPAFKKRKHHSVEQQQKN